MRKITPDDALEYHHLGGKPGKLVLVFPSLDAANVAYKLLARLGGAEAIGPILLGMGAPIHVLQAGDDVRDIVDIAAVAVMDAIGC